MHNELPSLNVKGSINNSAINKDALHGAGKTTTAIPTPPTPPKKLEIPVVFKNDPSASSSPPTPIRKKNVTVGPKTNTSTSTSQTVGSYPPLKKELYDVSLSRASSLSRGSSNELSPPPSPLSQPSSVKPPLHAVRPQSPRLSVTSKDPSLVDRSAVKVRHEDQIAINESVNKIKARDLPKEINPSYLTQAARTLAANSDCPIKTLDKAHYHISNFPELEQLQKTDEWGDLKNPKTVDAWRSFYAKISVIHQVLQGNDSWLYEQKLSHLFANPQFQEVLQKAISLFGYESNKITGGAASTILNTFNETVESWNKHVTASKKHILTLNPPQKGTLHPILQDRLKKITTEVISLDFFSNPSLLKTAALKLRESPKALEDYLFSLNLENKKDVYNVKHLRKEIIDFVENGLPGLNTIEDKERWKIFYAKICVLDKADLSLFAPSLEHSILKDVLKKSIHFFQNLQDEAGNLNDDSGNALEISTTFGEVLKKIEKLDKKEREEVPPLLKQLDGLEVKEHKESKEEEETPTRELSLKEMSGLIGIRYPYEVETEEIWGSMKVHKTGSNLKHHAVEMAKAQATEKPLPPSNLSSKDYTSVTKELDKGGLSELLKNKSIDLNNKEHVSLLQSFYAKMCVVEAEANLDKLKGLFDVPGFLDTLKNAIDFFDHFAPQNKNAKAIAQTFKNISDKNSLSVLDGFAKGQDQFNLKKAIDKIYDKHMANDNLIKLTSTLSTQLDELNEKWDSKKEIWNLKNSFKSLREKIQSLETLSSPNPEKIDKLKAQVKTKEEILNEIDKLKEEVKKKEKRLKEIDSKQTMDITPDDSFQLDCANVFTFRAQYNMEIAALTIQLVQQENQFPINEKNLQETKEQIEKLNMEKTKIFLKHLNLTTTSQNKQEQNNQAVAQLDTIDIGIVCKSSSPNVNNINLDTLTKIKNEMAATEISFIIDGVIESNKLINNYNKVERKKIFNKIDFFNEKENKELLKSLFPYDLKFYLIGLHQAKNDITKKEELINLLKQRYSSEKDLESMNNYLKDVKTGNANNYLFKNNEEVIFVPTAGYLDLMTKGIELYSQTIKKDVPGLGSALIQYAQRIPRIVLLNNELLKNGEPHAEGMVGLTKLHGLFINEWQRRNE